MDKYSKDHIKVNRDGTTSALLSALISVVESGGGDGDASVGGATAAAAESGGSEDLSFSPGYAMSSLLVRESESREGGS